MNPEPTTIESVPFFEVAYELFILLPFHELFSDGSINFNFKKNIMLRIG
jgi:hypothetical protein